MGPADGDGRRARHVRLADVFASELYGDAGYTHFVRDETRSDDQVLAKVARGLGVTGVADFAAWVLGDSSAQLFGAEAVGLPSVGAVGGSEMLCADAVVAAGLSSLQWRSPRRSDYWNAPVLSAVCRSDWLAIG